MTNVGRHEVQHTDHCYSYDPLERSVAMGESLCHNYLGHCAMNGICLTCIIFLKSSLLLSSGDWVVVIRLRYSFKTCALKKCIWLKHAVLWILHFYVNHMIIIILKMLTTTENSAESLVIHYTTLTPPPFSWIMEKYLGVNYTKKKSKTNVNLLISLNEHYTRAWIAQLA
jgi:hypothetical protein